MKKLLLLPLTALLLSSAQLFADPVFWANWTSATAGANGSATGFFLTEDSTQIDITYTGEIHFAQVGDTTGVNYWNPATPYISSVVDNAPTLTDIIALSRTTQKTLTFSEPVDNLFFAVVSLNGNGYRFDTDFDVVSFGAGFWGNGTLSKNTIVEGSDTFYVVVGTGEAHGVIRFLGEISSISWTTDAPETWNGFTVGTFGAIPEPAAGAMVLAGGAWLLVSRRRR